MACEIWKIDPGKIDPQLIQEAAKRIDHGELVIFPTETVYGVAVNLQDDKALERIYQIKKRPEEKPLTIHVGDRSVVEQWAQVTPAVQKVMDRWWPGPLTLLLSPIGEPPIKQEKLGFRFPDHRVAIALLKKVNCLVGAPSANRSGEPPPVTAMEAHEQLGDKVDLILDAGATPLAQASTIVDFTVEPPKVLREGAVPIDLI